MKKDTSGKSAALIKQLAFKRSLGLTESSLHRGKAYEVILADDDAFLGAAFYCYKKDKEWEGLQKWANEDKGKKVNFLGNGLKNLYRSEHIPFNVFYPLAKLKDQNDNKLNNLVELICGVKPDKVTHIKVEYSGDKKREEYLGDRTSFDAYLQFESENKTIGLGFEVKYTEKSYPFKSKEKRDLHDKNSQYMIVAKESGYYKDYDSGKLKSKSN